MSISYTFEKTPVELSSVDLNQYTIMDLTNGIDIIHSRLKCDDIGIVIKSENRVYWIHTDLSDHIHFDKNAIMVMVNIITTIEFVAISIDETQIGNPSRWKHMIKLTDVFNIEKDYNGRPRPVINSKNPLKL